MKYPNFFLKIINENGEVVHRYRTTKKRSLKYRLDRTPTRGCAIYIRVRYAKEYKNEGIYYTKKNALEAYRAFTEKDLIEDFI